MASKIEDRSQESWALLRQWSGIRVDAAQDVVRKLKSPLPCSVLWSWSTHKVGRGVGKVTGYTGQTGGGLDMDKWWDFGTAFARPHCSNTGTEKHIPHNLPLA